jgi:transcriptional regulator with XRE-family HTH domain
MKLGEWLSRKGMSQQAFAETIGVSQGAVARFVLGTRRPTKQTVEKIDEVTNGEVSPIDFYNVPRREFSAAGDAA